jgi:hypothetical protein
MAGSVMRAAPSVPSIVSGPCDTADSRRGNPGFGNAYAPPQPERLRSGVVPPRYGATAIRGGTR